MLSPEGFVRFPQNVWEIVGFGTDMMEKCANPQKNQLEKRR